MRRVVNWNDGLFCVFASTFHISILKIYFNWNCDGRTISKRIESNRIVLHCIIWGLNKWFLFVLFNSVHFKWNGLHNRRAKSQKKSNLFTTKECTFHSNTPKKMTSIFCYALQLARYCLYSGRVMFIVEKLNWVFHLSWKSEIVKIEAHGKHCFCVRVCLFSIWNFERQQRSKSPGI